MFKLDRKLIISASAIAVTALFAVGCGGGSAAAPAEVAYSNGKATIDGGSSSSATDACNSLTASWYFSSMNSFLACAAGPIGKYGFSSAEFGWSDGSSYIASLR